ncbi:MAG TPA: 2-dehydropantoate 2-reductase, partial [Arenicellales bacterium]|nr:2-dehydropantoate 2-reductase [Arenicellales bacterium]
MKVCVVGAGAIGGYMAVRIAAAGHEVSVVARGPHLAAIKAHGMKLIEGDQETISADLIATDKINELSSQDLVLMALKAHQIESIVADLTSVMGTETIMVTLQNGIPWWYFQNFSGPYAGRPVRAVDPRGKLFDGIDPDYLIGCIAYPAATIVEPGVIRHIEGNRFPVGELGGQESERVRRVSALLEEAGFKSRILDDIRSEIWL